MESFSIDVISPKNESLRVYAEMILMNREKVFDVFMHKDIHFDSGKTYGLIGEYMQGNIFVSYLLGGQVRHQGLILLKNGKCITKDELNNISWCTEPIGTKNENLIVGKAIKKALKQEFVKDSFDEIKELFMLTEDRLGNRLKCLSGERWRASMAIGYCLGKKIFYAPYETSMFYKNVFGLKQCFQKLKVEECIIILPTSSSNIMKNVADECIVVDAYIDSLEWTKQQELVNSEI